MARHTSLNSLVEQLRAECRLSTATSRGLDNLDYLEQILRRHYESLYDKYDWPFKRITQSFADKLTQAGERYYDFPATLNADCQFKVWHNDGSIWRELEHGITPEDYSASDSDADQRSSPLLKWDYYGDGQFEVWPLPVSDDEKIRFKGTRKMTALTDGDSLSDVDDTLIVLFAAAELLAGTNQKDAQIKADMAKDRLLTLKVNASSGKRIVLGKGGSSPRGGINNLRVTYTRS